MTCFKEDSTSFRSQLDADASQVRQLGSGSVGLQSVLFDNFARLGINKRILQVINWKTLSLFLRIIALALYLGHSVNQILVKCCEIGVLKRVVCNLNVGVSNV